MQQPFMRFVHRWRGLVLVVSCMTLAGASAQKPSLESNFNVLIERGLKEDPMPGIAVGIVDLGR